MSPEERDLLTKSIKLAEENNKMLRSMRRSARLGSFLRIIYWVLILASIYGTYYFIKPVIDPLISGYNSIKENVQTVKDTTVRLSSPSTWFGAKE